MMATPAAMTNFIDLYWSRPFRDSCCMARRGSQLAVRHCFRGVVQRRRRGFTGRAAHASGSQPLAILGQVACTHTPPPLTMGTRLKWHVIDRQSTEMELSTAVTQSIVVDAPVPTKSGQTWMCAALPCAAMARWGSPLSANARPGAAHSACTRPAGRPADSKTRSGAAPGPRPPPRARQSSRQCRAPW